MNRSEKLLKKLGEIGGKQVGDKAAWKDEKVIIKSITGANAVVDVIGGESGVSVPLADLEFVDH